MSKSDGKLNFVKSLFQKKQAATFTEEEIRKRAYEIWKSGNSKGNADQDWNAAIESIKLEKIKNKKNIIFIQNLLSFSSQLKQNFFMRLGINFDLTSTYAAISESDKQLINQKNSVDNFARLTSILSLIVAIAAVVVPYIQYRQEQEESVSINVNLHNIKEQVKLTKYNFVELGGRVVQVPSELVISNTANRKLSIVSYSISTGETQNSQYYSGIDGGIYDDKGKKVQLPIILEPGDSKILQIYIGIVVPPKVFDILSTLKLKPSLSSQQTFLTLARNKLDIYGNRVEFEEYPGGAYSWSIDNKLRQKSPRYWLQFTTGRGNSFVTSASEYEIPK